MSVINEMLKDLDKRKSNEHADVHESQASIYKQTVDYKLLIIAVLITGIVCFSVMSFLHSSQNVTVTKVAERNSVSEINAPVKAEPKSTPENTHSAPPKISPPAQSDITVKDAQRDSIELIKSAPINNGVITHKQPIEPSISDTKGELHKKAHANIVAPSLSEQTGKSHFSEITLKTSAPVITEPQQPELSIEAVSLTEKELANKKYKQAERAIKDTRVDLAEKLLEEAIILLPTHIEARKQLAALWYGRQANQQALNVLAQGIVLLPDNEEFRIMQARVYAVTGKFNRAYQVLSVLDNSLNSEYQQALANMASQSQQFKAAIKAYQKLLALYPEQGKWWLGLAIALDSDSQYQQANLAYRKALKSGHISESSVAFVKQRIVELGE